MPEDLSSDRVPISLPDLLASAGPDDPEVRRRVLDWLQQYPGSDAAHFLLGSLLSAAPDDPEVRRRALDWLQQFPGSDAAQLLLGSLLSAAPDDPEVRRRALDWLQQFPGPEAVQLLGPLLSAAPGDPDVRHRTLGWLQHYPGRGAAELFSRMLSAAPDDGEVRQRALDWLRHYPGPETVQLLGPLLLAAPDDAEVRERALDWLRHYPQADAARVLGPLLTAVPDDAEVRQRALDWLRHYPQADAARVLGPLLSAAPDDLELRHLALTWLDSNPNDPEAYGVLTSLLACAPDDPLIRDRAVEWHDTRRTCFLVGRVGTELRVLESALRKRNVTTITTEHLQAGGHLVSPLLAQMKNADFVTIIMHGATARPNVIFEAGVAAGLGKPVLVFSIGGHGFPFDLNSSSVVRLDHADVRIIEMHLDAFLSTLPQQKRTKQSKQTGRKDNSPEFAGALEQLEVLKANRDSVQNQPQQSNRAKDLARLGFQFENLVTDLFRLGGYTATSSPGPDYGVDLAVSSPKVQRDLGGPLLVQVKTRLAPSIARDAARGISKLVAKGRGSAGLVITLAEKVGLEEVLLQQPLILAMSAQRLIRLVERDNLVRTIVAARDQQLSPDL